jgi:UDP-galactopyranose mutase
MEFDFLIVGAGFAGLTVAERMATQWGKTSLVVEKRNHIGGNAYDRYNDHGVLTHVYGPHYFRTNSDKVLDYLSLFTDWHNVEYKIKSWVDGRFWNFPINLNTFEQLIGRPSTSEEMLKWLEENRVDIETPANSEEVIISQVGWKLYEMFFKGYTQKQWKRSPKELDASVCGRIPIRTNRDDRYLREKFQALPAAGYTRLFERMVDACGDRVKVMFNTDYRELLSSTRFKHMIYTGPIDEFFNHEHGALPYRSLRFEEQSFSPEELKLREHISGEKGFWQPAMQVNYPNEEAFTRIVEVKHATGQLCENSTIVREYPDDFGPGKEPYYPIPTPASSEIFKRYKSMSDQVSQNPHLVPELAQTECQGISFIGRLATYRYYNMDQVVAMALQECEKLEIKYSTL